MSMMHCDKCDLDIDTDLDAEHFVDHLDSSLSRVDATIERIHNMMRKPGIEVLTSNQLKNQADRRRDVVVTLKINRKAVKKDYL